MKGGWTGGVERWVFEVLVREVGGWQWVKFNRQIYVGLLLKRWGQVGWRAGCWGGGGLGKSLIGRMLLCCVAQIINSSGGYDNQCKRNATKSEKSAK